MAALLREEQPGTEFSLYRNFIGNELGSLEPYYKSEWSVMSWADCKAYDKYIMNRAREEFPECFSD